MNNVENNRLDSLLFSQVMFELKVLEDYPDLSLDDAEVTLENLFGIALAEIKKLGDNLFVNEMTNVWNDMFVVGTRRLVWIAARHLQFIALQLRNEYQSEIWNLIERGEKIIETSKKFPN